MSNFNFLQHTFPTLYAEAIKAEAYTFKEPKYAALLCRTFLELGLHWLYDNDAEINRPYDTKLHALLTHYEFKDSIRPSLYRELDLTRRYGNDGAHGKTVSARKALVALKAIFSFGVYLVKYYAEEEVHIPTFNEQIIPSPEGKIKDKTKKQLEKIAEEAKAQVTLLKKEQERVKALEKENQLLKEQNKLQRQQITSRKAARIKSVPLEQGIPQLTPEAETRKLYIDELLHEAGWMHLEEGTDIEFPVQGMPVSTNPSGKGKVDYVLWGDNGLPLAVVEAKSTLHDADKGKHQAYLYANCLEQQFGQRPIIFYTNGFETFLWEDQFYPARQVHGFYKKEELESLINQRKSRKDLMSFKVNTEISGRPYQLEAIKRVAQAISHNTENELKGKNRKALLVMATGSGKTRTSAAIVDMLTKCNWAKRILFLADRNALVTQAKNAFKEHLPHLSAIDLTKEKEDAGTRVVFSTYPTIMNRIDHLSDTNQRFYGVGHFDVIIIDEAHRSVYQKYSAIFEYFDAILIGLTATPKKDIDHNTYGLFDIDDDNPTFAYELNQAVNDKHLVPPKAMSVPVKFLREGIKYKDLSDKDKKKYEELFGLTSLDEEEEESPLISSSQMNSFLFNKDTVDTVLDHLMTNGVKVAGGDKIGKTIIFAKNHKHAKFIEERFNYNYPHYSGSFLEVIDNYQDKAQDLLERFCDDKQELLPQIAVSVDMMDTGVDAPRVVNLVFFKPVKSYAKYWQMIGRGTRLRPNLFGPNEDKKHFVIFDFCGNFEYFEEFPEGVSTSKSKSISQRIFETKLEIILAIRDALNATKEEDELAAKYTNELHGLVKALDEKRFEVRRVLAQVTKYKKEQAWQSLSVSSITELMDAIAPIVVVFSEKEHELAKRFDLICLRLELALLNNSKAQESNIQTIYNIGVGLYKKRNIPAVQNKIGLINQVKDIGFWKNISVSQVENIRKELRDLVKFIEQEQLKPVYSNFEDELYIEKVEEKDIMYGYTNLQSYKDRVESFIQNNKSHLVIDKLHKNIPITETELKLLERFLQEESMLSEEDYKKEYGELPLGKFVRSVIGLDIEVVHKLFANFIQDHNLPPNQITFIQTMINFLNKNGTLDKALLVKPPFTANHDEGIFGVFKEDKKIRKIIALIDEVNNNAG